MGVALYRKYRSKKLSDIVGQEHITKSLSNALKNGKISHAYLFTGPRGVGKTSIARILAHEINGLVYDEKANHLDIIEIDAASNRRIDEIRELRDKVHNAPANAKYKVYIIDEVHMLTKEAFNALLKTLEEPPEHAIFILATTEAHKLPDTIISRTQRYTFRPIDDSKAVDHLRTIAKSEGISISDDALSLIATHGDGSFRDSISLLDQVRNTSDKVTLQTVQDILGIAPSSIIAELLISIEKSNPQAVIKTLQSIQVQGYHAPLIARQLSEMLREMLLSNKGKLSRSAISRLLKELLEIPASNDPNKLLEIVLLEASLSDANDAPASVPLQPEPAAKPKAAPVTPTTPSNSTKPEPKQLDHETPSTPINNGAQLNEESWLIVLQAIKAKHNTLYSVARMAVPSFLDDRVTLTFNFPFHQKRLSDSKNMQIISDIIQQTTGKVIEINCVVDANIDPPAHRSTPKPKTNKNLETISNIFGSTEVIE